MPKSEITKLWFIFFLNLRSHIIKNGDAMYKSDFKLAMIYLHNKYPKFTLIDSDSNINSNQLQFYIRSEIKRLIK